MKRCPECSFIYEDDQHLCDMDGKALVPDRGPVPAELPKSSNRKRLAIRAIAGLALVTILFAVYYFLTRPGKTAPSKSAPAPTGHQASSGSTRPQQYAPTSVLDLQTDRPVVSSPSNTSQEPKEKTSETAKTTKTERAPDPRLTISKRIPPLRCIPPLPRLPAAKPAEKTSDRTRTSTTVVVTTPEPAKTPSKSTTAANKKESRFGSFLKRTGRVLAKPFKF